MPYRPLIATLLWLTYALLLGHDVLPHHHHKKHNGAVAHHQPSGQSHDHESDADEPAGDWWFAHQHPTGLTLFSSSHSEQYQQAPIVADIVILNQPDFLAFRCWPGQTVGWPPAQAKAPPGQHRYRPLRAPPVFLLIA